MLNYHEATLTMIDYEGNNYQPDKQAQPQPSADKPALDWLEANMDFRPIGDEW